MQLGTCDRMFSIADQLVTGLKPNAGVGSGGAEDAEDAGSCPVLLEPLLEKASSGKPPYLIALLTARHVTVTAFDDAWSRIASLTLDGEAAHLRGEDEGIAVEGPASADAGVRVRHVTVVNGKLAVSCETWEPQ